MASDVPAGMENDVPYGTENERLTRILRGVWPSLPALLCASAAGCAAATAAVLPAPGANPLTVLLCAVLAGPFGGALAATAHRIAADGEASVRDWWHGLRTLGPLGLRSALVPAVPCAAFLAGLRVHEQTGGGWVLPSLAVSSGLGALALLGLPAVLPLAAARPRLRGRLLWVCALHLVARRPLRFLAAPSLAALGLWAAVRWSASLLLLVPAPVAVVMTAAVWTTLAAPPRS